MQEYFKFRCCVCPNGSERFGSRLAKPLCPPNPISKKPETSCRFVKDYIDEFGNIYTVLGNDKLRYRIRQMPAGKSRWMAYGTDAYKYFDEAQGELNRIAEGKAWTEHPK